MSIKHRIKIKGKIPTDLETAQDFLERFKKKCMSTLDVMKVKWTPKG